MNLDWNDVRYFVAVARDRRLAKAAKKLGVDQTTVGRRLASLEQKLRTELFSRTPGGWLLTPSGERILAAAERMTEAAEELSAHAADEREVTGTVTIATSETIAEYFVVPALRDVALRHPTIRTIVSSQFARVDLMRGEADLAIRLAKPTDPRLVCKKLVDRTFRLYASRAYIAERGLPTTPVGHSIITYDEAANVAQPFQRLPAQPLTVTFQSNSARVQTAAAIAGLGIVQLPDYVGIANPELVHVLPDMDAPYPIWLVIPQAKRRAAAIKIVADAVARAFAA